MACSATSPPHTFVPYSYKLEKIRTNNGEY